MLHDEAAMQQALVVDLLSTVNATPSSSLESFGSPLRSMRSARGTQLTARKSHDRRARRDAVAALCGAFLRGGIASKLSAGPCSPQTKVRAVGKAAGKDTPRMRRVGTGKSSYISPTRSPPETLPPWWAGRAARRAGKS